MRLLIPYWSAAPQRGFYQDFHAGMTHALRESGHQVLPFQYAQIGRFQTQEATALCALLERERPAAALDLACWGNGLSQIAAAADGGIRPIFDAFDMPYVGMLLDQPYNQPINHVVAGKHYATYPDLGHPQQVKLVFPRLRIGREAIAPPAVRTENDRSTAQDLGARDIDVLYIGHLELGALERFWQARPGQSPVGLLPQFCNVLADTILAAPEQSLHVSAHQAIADFGALPPGFSFGRQLQAVELHCRHVFRRDAVLAVAGSGLRMTVVGRGWRQLALPEPVRICEETGYDGMFRLAARSRICLDASTYLDGANDRVFNYGLNRAVCFTNAAGYLRRATAADAGVEFYSMRDTSQLGARMRALLARPELLQDAGERARAAVLAAHTWPQRLPGILDLLRDGSQ